MNPVHQNVFIYALCYSLHTVGSFYFSTNACISFESLILFKGLTPHAVEWEMDFSKTILQFLSQIIINLQQLSGSHLMNLILIRSVKIDFVEFQVQICQFLLNFQVLAVILIHFIWSFVSSQIFYLHQESLLVFSKSQWLFLLISLLTNPHIKIFDDSFEFFHKIASEHLLGLPFVQSSANISHHASVFYFKRKHLQKRPQFVAKNLKISDLSLLTWKN